MDANLRTIIEEQVFKATVLKERGEIQNKIKKLINSDSEGKVTAQTILWHLENNI